FTVNTAAPPIVNADAVLLKVIDPTVRFAMRFGVSDVPPAKTRLSPDDGDCAGLQFPAVLMSPSPAAPVHVNVAARPGNAARHSIPARKTDSKRKRDRALGHPKKGL